MNVEICRDPLLWDGYVETRLEASNYHRWIWKEPIQATFEHESYYLAAMDRGGLEGVLPLFWIYSRLFGSAVVSVPFFSFGGVLASSPKARDCLLAAAVEVAQGLGARHVELRQGQSSDYGWCDTAAKVKMEVELPADPELLWKGLSSRLRNKIRNAEKAGFRAQWGGVEEVANFYPVLDRKSVV